MNPQTYILIGVCGAGKSLLGSKLAVRIHAEFDDSDDYHLPVNRARLTSGIALTDEDRRPWYAILRNRIVEVRRRGGKHVLACSALSSRLRSWLCEDDAAGSVTFVLLESSRELIEARMKARRNHFMPASLLDSQLATLEITPDLIRVRNDAEPDDVIERLVLLLNPRSTIHSSSA